MKKLFTMLVVSFCGTMAYAQTDAISVNDVTIAKGGSTQMEVTVNNAASNTAFQFDLKLPAGVSVKSATMNSGAVTSNAEDTQSRKLLHNLYKESDNVYRFLSYDNANEVLTDGKVSITLEAADEAETAEVEIAGSDILVVNPEGTKTTQDNGDVASITVSDGVNITIPAGLKLVMVSDKDLDFSSLESQGAKAYICTGYEVETKTFWMTRVNDVPANTPIMVKGEKAGDLKVPVASSRIYYPQNFLVGSATSSFNLDTSEGYINYVVSKSTGNIGATTLTSLDAGKAYFHVPSSVASAVASESQKFTMGKGKKLMCVSDYDLDFENVEGLKAYVVTGFDFDKTIWLSRVMKASAGTPLLLRGETSEGEYTVPSVATKIAYVNMLKGNTSSEAVTISPEMDGNTIFVMSKSTGIFGTIAADMSMAKGKVWLPVPSSFIAKIPAATRGVGIGINDLESEMISIQAVIGGEDGETTGISRVANEADNDAWYNLNGQRIDTPTRKGLYIKNGKKVIVK